MVWYLLVAAITILLAHYVRERKSVNMLCLLLIFGVLFFLSVIRYDVGGDYETYTNRFHELNVDGYTEFEIGNKWVVKAVYFLCGFECYEAVFALFALVTLVLFLKAFYEQSESFEGTFFLFMTLGLYFQTFNTVRYYLALAMALYSMRYILRKQYLRFVLVILLAALFHKSVLVIIPLYLLANCRIRLWHYAVLGGLAASSLVFHEQYLQLLLRLYPSYVGTPFLEGGTSYAGIIRCVLVIAFALYYGKDTIKGNPANRFYVNLNALALILYLFGSFIPVISRIGYYMTISQILLVPSVYQSIPEGRKKKIIGIVIVAGMLVYFALYLRGLSHPDLQLLPYQTWIFPKERFVYP